MSTGGTTIRVVVDLNVFVAALLGSPSCRDVLAAIADGTATLVCSRSLIRELRGVVARPKFRGTVTTDAAEELVEFLESHALFLTPRHLVKLSRDPDDNHLLSLALESHASALISGDKDITSLRSVFPVPILTPGEFAIWLATR